MSPTDLRIYKYFKFKSEMNNKMSFKPFFDFHVVILNDNNTS